MKKSLHYKIEFSYDPQKGLFTARVPALKGLSAVGETFAEAEANIQAAALQYLESLHLDKKPLPLDEKDLIEGIYIRIPRP
ncbi:MAG: type II toxin-antitoxin system HicB family antitoxin [Desulfobacteraceae bacterium]